MLGEHRVVRGMLGEHRDTLGEHRDMLGEHRLGLFVVVSAALRNRVR